MALGNSKKNLVRLGWYCLEERCLQTKIIIFHKARLNFIDIETEQLAFKSKQTRMGGGELAYNQSTSAVASHSFFHLQFTFRIACQVHSSPVRIWLWLFIHRASEDCVYNVYVRALCSTTFFWRVQIAFILAAKDNNYSSVCRLNIILLWVMASI